MHARILWDDLPRSPDLSCAAKPRQLPDPLPLPSSALASGWVQPRCSDCASLSNASSPARGKVAAGMLFGRAHTARTSSNRFQNCAAMPAEAPWPLQQAVTTAAPLHRTPAQRPAYPAAPAGRRSRTGAPPSAALPWAPLTHCHSRGRPNKGREPFKAAWNAWAWASRCWLLLAGGWSSGAAIAAAQACLPWRLPNCIPSRPMRWLSAPASRARTRSAAAWPARAPAAAAP